MRDDFSQRTKDLLANRVGWKCSNPNCRKATRGAGTGKENIINIGIASHITAASKGGPRYDENITSQERASAENGIWLCQSCSKLIDSDVNRYTIAKLKKWKEISEQMAVLDLEEATAEEQHEDKELIKFFVQCFDRPAFQDRIYQEGRMEDFDRAIEDTIIALNTGVLRTRDGCLFFIGVGFWCVVFFVWGVLVFCCKIYYWWKRRGGDEEGGNRRRRETKQKTPTSKTQKSRRTPSKKSLLLRQAGPRAEILCETHAGYRNPA